MLKYYRKSAFLHMVFTVNVMLFVYVSMYNDE